MRVKAAAVAHVGLLGRVFPFSAGGGGSYKWLCGAEQFGMADRRA